MLPFEQIEAYCDQVSEQIRWKKAKPILVAEIKNHLCDQRDAYLSGGEDEALATQKAIAQMGDAVFVGQELDKTHRPKPQWFMMALTGVFMLLGFGVNSWINSSVDSLHTVHVFPYLLAFALFLCCYLIDFSVLARHGRKIYGFVLIISIMGVLYGTGFNGRLVWSMGRFSISLSYLSLIFPVVFALFIYSMRNRGPRGILISGASYLPLAFILFLIPSFAGLVLFTVAALLILCFAIGRGWFGSNKKQGLLLVLLPTFVCFICLSVAVLPMAANRLDLFLHPEQDRYGTGYLYCLIRDILSNAVFCGTGGIPPTIESISHLPNIGTDYSLVYLIHRFGSVVLVGITLLLSIFSAVGIYKALKEKSVLGSMLALSIMLPFVLQTVFYLIDNLGYGLLSSLSLPLISYGNSALIINAALIGLMLSVFRTGECFREPSAFLPGNHARKNDAIFTYHDGKLVIRLKSNA